MESSFKCDICNIDVQRASFAKHLKMLKAFRKNKTKGYEYTRLVI